MKKSSFTALMLGTVSGVLFALGFCMALIPEWNAFKPGIVFGSVGLLLSLIHIFFPVMVFSSPCFVSEVDGDSAASGVRGGVGLSSFAWQAAVPNSKPAVKMIMTIFLITLSSMYPFW